MQDLEFTVERGKLFLLQTRTGKRTAAAAVRIARDMVNEGLIDRIRGSQARSCRSARPATASDHRSFGPGDAPLRRACRRARARQAASPSSIRTAPRQRAAAGEHVILVRDETTPEDFHGIVAARAVLTARGGMTSHAAVVARGMGKCAIVGCKDIHVDAEHRASPSTANEYREGDWLTLDGATGRVFAGESSDRFRAKLSASPAARSQASQRPLYQSYAELLGWADEIRTLSVRANADTPRDARMARSFGAEGIGLCRTEHMFFEGDRITPMREMIVARDEGWPAARARQAPADAALGLRGNLRGDERISGYDPPARPAAARISPARRRREQAACAHTGSVARRSRSHCRVAA